MKKKKNEDRGSAVAPHVSIAVRRGSDADLLDEVHDLVPILSRGKIGLIGMRIGLEAFAAADEKKRSKLLAKYGRHKVG